MIERFLWIYILKIPLLRLWRWSSTRTVLRIFVCACVYNYIYKYEAMYKHIYNFYDFGWMLKFQKVI